MSAAVLMSKLLEIERSVGRVDPVQVRSMVIDAQKTLLDYQQEIIHTLHHAAGRGEPARRPQSATLPLFPSSDCPSADSELSRIPPSPAESRPGRVARLFAFSKSQS